MKPISPKDASLKAITKFPKEVIETFNELIIENLKVIGVTAGVKKATASFTQDTVVARICTKMDITRSEVFDNKYLDIEPLFEGEGWFVEYDKPAYNENYPSKFTFTSNFSINSN